MFVGSAKPGIGGELLAGQEIKPKYSVNPKGQGSDLPSWIVFDKQVNCLKIVFTLQDIHTFSPYQLVCSTDLVKNLTDI